MNWDQVKSEVEDHGGVLTVSMEALRDAAGAKKLGIHVRTKITKRLAGSGLGHVPTVLPANQSDQVRLYKKGTHVGDLIDTVLQPGQQNDRKLAEYSEGEGADYKAIVDAVRELVVGE